MNTKVLILILGVIFITGCTVLQPAVSIVAPSDGQKIVGSLVTVDLNSANVEIAEPDGTNVEGEGHFYVSIGDSEQSGARSSFTFALSPDTYTVRAELRRGDNTPLASDAVTFTVIPQLGSDVREFNISVEGGAFNPNVITVQNGDTIVLNIRAVDAVYGFSLGTYDIVEQIPEGEEKMISFVVDRVGEFNFFCGGFCASEYWDMRGKLIVTD